MNAYKIVVADDDDGIREPIVSLLQDHGFFILEARTEEELLMHAANPNAVLWIIDVRLPTRSYEGILAVKDLHAKGIIPKLPILFISVEAEDFAQDKLEGLKKLGVKYEWLEKPFELEYLLRRIQTFLCDYDKRI